MDLRREDGAAVPRYETWTPWPVSWSAVWVGALAALATGLIIGLAGVAVGAQVVKGDPWVETGKVGWGTLFFSVFGSFIAFVVGGWVAGRVAGIRRAEPAMLHGAITWLLAVPMLLVAAAIGAGGFFGGWHSGLGGSPGWSSAAPVTFDPPADNAPQRDKEVYQESPAKYQKHMAAKVARNTALGAVTALLLGLIGSVIGGWMASGEPMTLSHHRTRGATVASHPANTSVPIRV
jgi:hypothetical protein